MLRPRHTPALALRTEPRVRQDGHLAIAGPFRVRSLHAGHWKRPWEVGGLCRRGHRKRIWSAGLVIFTASSALCGAAFSLWFLIAARALQGLGRAFLFSTSPALLTSAFPEKERGRALGTNAVTVALGTSIGPTLGGLITASLSWRWIFFVNLPLGVIGLILTARILRETRTGKPVRFDPWGAMFLGVGLASLIGALSFGSDLGLRSPLIIGRPRWGSLVSRPFP